MSKPPPPAPTASAIGPCPTVIEIVGRPRHWKFTQHHRTTRPPPTTTELSKLFVLLLSKNMLNIVKKSMKGPVKIFFWSITNSCEVLNQLKSRGFRASSLSSYDFSTLYTTLPHNLIKDKLVDLIERTFQREGSLYIACNDKNAFFTSDAV